MAQYNILPENTYNMDEKGFLIGILQKTKRIFTKNTQIRGSGQDGNRIWVTIVATICMDGSYLPPSIIYPAASGIQNTWLEDFKGDENAFFTSSPTGWTNDSIGLAWVKEIFDRHTKKKARNGRDSRLLFVDGHGSHLNMPFLDWCDRHNIIITLYPPHSTHRLQPLDVGLFNPLANYYSQQLNQWIHDTQGLIALGIRHFFGLFWPAFVHAFSEKNIASSWMKTGLLPFDPEQVLHQVEKPKSAPSTRPNSSGSTAISTNDWIKVHRLVKDAVGDSIGPEIRKLSNTIEHLAAQNSILNAENTGLRRAVFIEKKKRVRAKPLLDSLRDIESGALFASPSKVQQAREQLEAKDNEKNQLIEQRLVEKEAKQAQREIKNQEALQRKAERQQARLRRAEETEAKKAIKEAAVAAKQIAQQHQTDLKAQAKHQTKKARGVRVQTSIPVPEKSDGEVDVPEIETGRLGRAVKLPLRYHL